MFPSEKRQFHTANSTDGVEERRHLELGAFLIRWDYPSGPQMSMCTPAAWFSPCLFVLGAACTVFGVDWTTWFTNVRQGRDDAS